MNGDQRAGPGSLAEQARLAGWVSRLAGRARTSPYYPALAHLATVAVALVAAAVLAARRARLAARR